MKFKAGIFDLDGTLVHTAPEYRYNLIKQVLKEFGLTAENPNIDQFWFMADRDRIIREKFNVEPSLFWDVYRKKDVSEVRVQFTRVYDDIDFIQDLRQRGYKTGIVTGTHLNIASLEIGLIGRNNFDAFVLANKSATAKEKPHPYGLKECLKLLDVNKKEAFYVGNADEDIETARNAGVFDVFIHRGEHNFAKLKPSLEIKSLYDLGEFLEF